MSDVATRRPLLPSESRAAGLALTWPTVAFGLAAAGTAAAFIAAEVARIWRLGSLPEHHSEENAADDETRPTRRGQAARVLRIAREGYTVSRARRNAVFNMLGSFMVTFAGVRGITAAIRRSGGFGPLRNVQLGDRHIHHFVPGMIICLVTGAAAVGSKDENLRSWLAIPFGSGVALVLDETALLLELEDVYWSEEGVLSLQVAFAGMALLAAAGYTITFLRAGTARMLEADWQAAARAWDDVSVLSKGR